MGRTACTEPQCLYKGALYLYLTVKLYLYSPYGPYGLYRASVPVQGWPLPLHKKIYWPNLCTSGEFINLHQFSVLFQVAVHSLWHKFARSPCCHYCLCVITNYNATSACSDVRHVFYEIWSTAVRMWNKFMQIRVWINGEFLRTWQ